MPHCQKEKHNHSTKSKKERQKAKQEGTVRKKRLQEERLAAEAEAALKLSNNIAPVDGHGTYEVGYEPEPEYHRFNVKKRSKKHLRQDLRKAQLREQQEDEERRIKEKAEDYRREQLALKEASGEISDEMEEDEEEDPDGLEYFVFICECCDKRYATKNQFLNHVKSKKHRSRVRIYEDLGLLVTHVELRGANGNEKELYNDYEDDNDNDDDDNNDEHEASDGEFRRTPANRASDEESGSGSEESEDESDDDYVPNKKSVFAAFAAGFSSSSEDESSDSDDDDENDGDENDSDGDDRKPPPLARQKDPPPSTTRAEDETKDDQDGHTIDFEELIYQNQLLQNEMEDAKGGTIAEIPPTPLPFHETYDPKDYGVNENRLASVQHRLRKNLASKGIEPSAVAGPYDPLQAITMGKTLLQQVLEANIDTLQQKLDTYNQHKKDCALMSREFALAKGTSKALPSQYVFKQATADNARRRANVHHAGSHYHMQAARSMQFGRQKGLMARHSSQGARLQASRMSAKDTARMQQGGGGSKIGKTSQKSNQKRRGEAGGSKKSGGKKGAGAGGD